MCLDDLVKYCQVLAYLSASVGIIFSAFTYRNTNRIKRGEWLKDLFDKFYKEKNFSEVRREIEYDRLNNFLGIDAKGMATNEEHEEALVNYLNFFEFISTLVKKKHLHDDEVKDMFGYYLLSLSKNQFIKTYISQFGFENLEKILKNYE